MEAVREDVFRYADMDVLNPLLHKTRRRRKDDLMFISVVFEEGGQRYTYLCPDETVMEGDRVLAPVGKDARATWVKVVDIRWLSEKEAPYPLGKIKTVIGKEPAPDMVEEAIPPELLPPPVMDAALLLEEPLMGVETEDIREMLGETPGERALAAALAQVSNKIAWLAMKSGEQPESRAYSPMKAYLDEWRELEGTLRSQAFGILFDEGRLPDMKRTLSHQVTDELLKRNGYEQAGKWWAFQPDAVPEIVFSHTASWNHIKSQEDIDRLLRDFNMHNGLVREIQYIPPVKHRKKEETQPPAPLRVLYQTQWLTRAMFEFVFENPVDLRVKLRPEDSAFSPNGAFLAIEDDGLVWFDENSYEVNYREMYNYAYVTWIKAGKIKWREIHERADEESE